MKNLTPKILIVDDIKANLIALNALLKRMDVEVIQASSGNDALGLVLEHDFALFLFDVQMPEMDGYELAEILMHEDSTKDIPVIFITAAMKDELNRIKGYEHGAIDYIEKPINDAILKAKVKILLNMWQQRQQLNILLDDIAEKNIALQTEVAERKKVEQRLNHMASYDSLTELPNRHQLDKEATKIISTAKRYDHRVAFMFLDLDGFKKVNDNNGHDIGDAVLVESALRMQKAVRDIDVVARFGGDEFIIVLPDCHTNADVSIIAKRIIDHINQPLESVNIVEKLGVSIGIAIYSEDGMTKEELLTLADKAMYEAKKSGKNQFKFTSE